MAGIIIKPNTTAKLDILADNAKYDVCLASCNTSAEGRGRTPDPEDPLRKWIYPANVPGKGLVSILKVLQTNVCKNHCSYCQFAANKDEVQRTTLKPDELARSFMDLLYRRLVTGLFLSSGVCGRATKSMERMIKTADILRHQYKYDGYIHLKILPGTPFHLVEKAVELATRVSINLEAPTKGHLSEIAPDKSFARDLVSRMKWAGELIQNKKGAFSQTTQLVVGASDETDLDIMQTTDWIYRELFVYRTYYSAFQRHQEPKSFSPEPKLLREHRLYQSDFLLRGYGFRLPELVFDENGRLPLRVDPKTAHAMMHPELFPVDINKAEEDTLLKVPGIGPLSARRIVEGRVKDPFHNIEELKGSGAIVSRAAPYVEFSGSGTSQIPLFENPPPTSWTTGKAPAGMKNRIKQTYLYPGQAGRRLNYSGFDRKKTVLCR